MRSYWKGPYFNTKLTSRLVKTETYPRKPILYTRDRSSTILDSYVGRTVAVYNGLRYYFIKIKPEHIGSKLGEFAYTRKTASYKKKRNKKKKNFKK